VVLLVVMNPTEAKPTSAMAAAAVASVGATATSAVAIPKASRATAVHVSR
jgi:hypothetical protein